MKLKLLSLVLLCMCGVFLFRLTEVRASAPSPLEVLSSKIAELSREIAALIQTGTFTNLAASTSASIPVPVGGEYHVSHVNDAVRDQKLFKPTDAQLGYIATDGTWSLVLNPPVSANLQLFNLLNDLGKPVDVSAAHPDIVNTLRTNFLQWRVAQTEVPLSGGVGQGGVVVAGDVYTFSTPGSVTFAQNSSQSIGKGDVTFVTHIKSVGRDKTVRLIAAQPNAWSLQINAQNQLALTLYDASTSLPVTIVGNQNTADTLIAQNTDYDVMFDIVGMSHVKNFARLSVRKSGTPFTFAGQGVGVTSIAGNQNPVSAGSVVADSAFIGVIQKPRMFLGDLGRGQVDSIYSQLVNSCTKDGVSVNGGYAATFYDTSVVMSPDTCAAHAQSRACLASTLRGTSDYVYSSCTVTTGAPLIRTLASSTGGVTVMPLTGTTVLNIQQTASGRPSARGMKDHYYEISVFRSEDNGVSWIASSTLFATTTASTTWLNISNVLITKLKNGDLMAVYRQHRFDGPAAPTARWAIYQLRSALSHDQGKTWQNYAVIDSRPDDGSNGTWEPFIIEASKRPGVIQAYFALERPRVNTCPNLSGNAQNVIVKESIDGGKSWGPGRAALVRGASREGVPAVTELVDGSLLAVFETWRSADCLKPNPNLTIGQARSNDGGLTWKYLPSIFTTVQGAYRQSWPYMTRLADGRLLLKFASTANYASTTQPDLKDIELVTTENVPTYVTPPQWNKYPLVAIPLTEWGNVAQLSNGDVLAVGTKAAAAVYTSTVPLQLLGRISN